MVPHLDELAPLPRHRFVPDNYEQYTTAVYVLWNLLDGIIHQEMRGHQKPNFPFGYMRKVQLQAYSGLVWKRRDIRTYCETGVNGGHGTAAMLLANPLLVSHSFDLGAQPYSDKVFRTLQYYFGERIIIHRGDSHKLLPAFLSDKTRGQCDLLLIDGDHSEHGAYRDIVDFHPLAACNAKVLLDDIVETNGRLNGGPQRALRRAEAEGLLRPIERHVYNQTSVENPCLRAKDSPKSIHCFAPWGWAIARYNEHPSDSPCRSNYTRGPMQPDDARVLPSMLSRVRLRWTPFPLWKT